MLNFSWVAGAAGGRLHRGGPGKLSMWNDGDGDEDVVMRCDENEGEDGHQDKDDDHHDDDDDDDDDYYEL